MRDGIQKYLLKINHNQLTIVHAGNEKIITFSFPVSQLIQFEQIIVVSVEPEQHHILNENLFGVSYGGKILWQIEKMEHVSNDSPYMGIAKKNEMLSAYNWDGFRYLINPETGKIIDKEFVK